MTIHFDISKNGSYLMIPVHPSASSGFFWVELLWEQLRFCPPTKTCLALKFVFFDELPPAVSCPRARKWTSWRLKADTQKQNKAPLGAGQIVVELEGVLCVFFAG